MQSKVIGIIGGIAPPSTMDYYQRIVAGFLLRTRTGHDPSILINSIDMTKMLELVSNKDYEGLVNYLSGEIHKLERGGADFAALSSNTPHIVFDRLNKKCNINLISIVDATVAFAKKLGLRKLGLFGTKFTMQSGFYQSGFSRENLDIITPPIEAQDYIHYKYMNEFVKGIFLPDTKNKMITIANEMIRSDSIEGLILGGTELPFILKKKDFNNFILLNTTEIHVESILEYALKN